MEGLDLNQALYAGGLALLALLAFYPCARTIYHALTGPSELMKLKLKNKHVFITGASQGLGKALADILANEYGAQVSIAARREDILHEVKKEIEEKGAKSGNKKISVSVCPCDVTSEESVNRALNTAKDAHGDVDVLIACAGAAIMGYFHEMPLYSFKKEMDLNYLGAVIPLKPVVASWVDKFEKEGKPLEHARFVLVSSAVGMNSFVGYSAYSPTKFALRGLAECLRNELIRYGVKVHISYPGNIDTPGYAEENRTKPRPTLAIEESFGPEPADKVARSIINGMLLEQFNIFCDDAGSILLGRLTGGVVPRNTLLIDALVTPPLVLLGGVFRMYTDYVASHPKHYTPAKQGSSKGEKDD